MTLLDSKNIHMLGTYLAHIIISDIMLGNLVEGTCLFLIYFLLGHNFTLGRFFVQRSTMLEEGGDMCQPYVGREFSTFTPKETVFVARLLAATTNLE